jgi:hypothetical protein
MPLVATTPLDTTAVRSWRLQQLLAAGYPRREARLLSEREDIDLHLATNLLLNGCPIETALRILL